METGAQLTLPAAQVGANRMFYFFDGTTILISGTALQVRHAVEVYAEREVVLANTGSKPAHILMLQAQPLREPVAKHGPFVMNTALEIQEAFHDYQLTHFGNWPWPSDAPVHDKASPRFAIFPDGHRESPAKSK
jgi:redox-sensitive bicupin YhaK (pirin superfamily)